MKNSKLTGVVLAGGQGQRMGGTDKAQLELGGGTLLARVVGSLAEQVDRVIVNSNTADLGRVERAEAVIGDVVLGFAGPLAGVDAAMRWNAEQPEMHPFVLSIATDTPFFPHSLASEMLAAVSHDSQIAIAQSRGINQPVFGLWPQRLHEDLAAWLEDPSNRKVMAWVRQHDHVFVEFPPYAKDDHMVDPFFNINTPDDLATANRMIRSGM